MVTNFELITPELSDDEFRLIPYLVAGFRLHPKSDPIKSPLIVEAINSKKEAWGIKGKFTDVRLRKCVNYIRSKGMIPLIATSDGYYTSWDKADIQKQIQSLHERASSILTCAEGLKLFLNE